MNAPLPEVPLPSSTKKSEAPEGLRWIVALQIGTFLLLVMVMLGPELLPLLSPLNWEQYELTTLLLGWGLTSAFVVIYVLPFVFLARGSRWARWLVIGLPVFLYGSDWLWPEFSEPEDSYTALENGLDYFLDVLWIWTLIYLFLPKVRAYFRSK